ncbi:MAG: ATP-binding protein [Anaerolineae bacterium]|nr:ATP-binding protein [Anaerolineae bacterium]
MDSERKLTFPGRFDSLAAISEFVGAAAESAGLDARGIYEVELAVDEASSNIIEHAYGGEGRGDIQITCRIDRDRLTFILRDFGRPFDPANVAQPDLGASLEDRDSGGLGVYLMRQLMDEVDFQFTPDAGNALTMVKRRTGPRGEPNSGPTTGSVRG